MMMMMRTTMMMIIVTIVMSIILVIHIYLSVICGKSHRMSPSFPKSSRKPLEGRSLQLDYLYASPLDLASLDVRAEINALAVIPGVKLTVRGR